MKYAVLTYIFGENKEILREPLIVDNNVEYICVTDQRILKSKVWKIIYDPIENAKCTRDKMVYVKYSPFKYTDAEYICVIDGTLEINSSLLPLFSQAENKDLLLKRHPERDNLLSEIVEWIRYRGMLRAEVNGFQKLSEELSVDPRRKFLLESCIIIFSRSEQVKLLCRDVIKRMEELGNPDRLFLSNQCILTLLIQNVNFENRIGFIDQKKFFKRYDHGTMQLHDR